MNEEILYTVNDGLLLAPVGSWAITKYKLVYEYDRLFSTGMKKSWDTRVYIDLFSGPGKGIIEKQNKILSTSPILSLLVPDKFDRYIFCDIDKNIIETLKKRVDANHNIDNVSYLIGDSNKIVDQIINTLPEPSPQNRVLSFCFVDPFSLCIEFETIKKLSK
jgi:three-Cys-motif partner protein